MQDFFKMMNLEVRKDIEWVVSNLGFSPDLLDEKTVLVTGATGLIGRFTVLTLLAIAELNKISIKVYAQGRNLKKLENVFSCVMKNKNLHFVESDLMTLSLNQELDAIDYIIHGASPTSSKDFATAPIGVIRSIYQTTLSLLNLAVDKNVLSFVYLSSMEVYGEVLEDRPVSESEVGYLDILSPRSSYPQAKRLAELMCSSFFFEKGTPIKIARLCMVFGPDNVNDDQRVLSFFIRQALKNESINLLTPGKSKAPVLYLREAVQGILLLLMKGINGQAYNLANPKNYMSIYEMAQITSKLYKVSVSCPQESEHKHSKCEKNYFRNDSFLNLDISKMKSLGWNPQVELEDILRNVYNSKVSKK